MSGKSGREVNGNGKVRHKSVEAVDEEIEGEMTMKKYKTSEVAAITGLHPNTVRYYEEWGLISRPERQANGYRVFTELHIQQIQLARIAFQIEMLQNGLRKKIIEVVKCAANCDFDKAIELTAEYRKQFQMEDLHAKEAITIVRIF